MQFDSQLAKHDLVETFEGTTRGNIHTQQHKTSCEILSCFHVKHFEISPLVLANIKFCCMIHKLAKHVLVEYL